MFRRQNTEDASNPADGDFVVVVDEAVNSYLVMFHEPAGFRAEQIRSLRNRLVAMNPDGEPKSLVVTSAVRGEGKSVATLNLALAMVEVPRQRVLVIDGHLRNPSLETYLGLPRRMGLADVMMGQVPLEQAIRRTSVDRLDILATGALPEFQSDFLNVDRMRAVLDAVKRHYDYVLIDAPARRAAAGVRAYGAGVAGPELGAATGAASGVRRPRETIRFSDDPNTSRASSNSV